MDKKQIKRVVRKNVKKAEVKGTAIKKAVKKNVKDLSARGASLLKKERKVAKKTISRAQAKGVELQAMAMKEYAKIKKQMDATAKQVEAYVKKNPEKSAAIAAGVGMALGAVAGILASGGKKKKK